MDENLCSPNQEWNDPLAYAGYVPQVGVNVLVIFGKRKRKNLPAALGRV